MDPMKIQQFAVITIAVATALLSSPEICRASDSSAAIAVVHAAGAAFNRGDLKAFAALCDSPAYVIDDFAPHQWDGPDACTNWANALTANMKQNGIANGVVVFGEPWHAAVTGNIAYVVVPATLTYTQKGKPVKEAGSVWTLVLRKTANGWRITSWAWAQH